MHSDMEENWDAYQEVYKTPNMGTNLEPRSLRQKNGLQNIGCFQWEWECEEGQGVHKDVLGIEDDFQ